jgi:hypothetical protein
LPDVLHGEIKRFKETPVDDGTEAGVNRRYYLDMFETDILLNAHQATHILSEIKSCTNIWKLIINYLEFN